MNKLDMQSENIINDNIEYIQKKFPNVVVESEKGYSIDFNALKQELSNVIVDETKEKYQLTWPGKKEAILTANTPTTKTLRPLREKSVNFDTTENIYIEGDNLEALKILQESYLGKIKCIYIDPPYNTGNDFIYKDNFNKDINQELLDSGQIDEEGNRLVANNQSNGRFHSDWLSMMYPRLKLARNLLSVDGIIFISIGKDEENDLEKICNEIFGESAKIGIIVQDKANVQNDATNIQNNHDYILVYQKEKRYNGNKEKKSIASIEQRTIEVFKDKKGFYYFGSGIVTGGEGGTLNHRPNLGYTIYFNPKTDDKIAMLDYDKSKAKYSNNEDEVYNNDKVLLSKGYDIIRPPKKGALLGAWTWSLEKFEAEKDKIEVIKSKVGYQIKKKEYVSNSQVTKHDGKYFYEKKIEKNVKSIWRFPSSLGTLTLNELFDTKYFDNPKNLDMIKKVIKVSQCNKDIILDFFSGSATTAHAVMQLNAEDEGKRKYIMVQLPELCDEKSESYKAGYKTICDLGEERIRRAAKKIKEETNANIDYGIRVYKIDSSNMKDVYYKPSQLNQEQLNMFETNIKGDRTAEDLLTQVILDLGLTLDLKIEEKNILNNKVYFVDQNSLIACFDDNVDINIIDEICKIKPLKVVFKDSSFKNDNDKINVEERIKKLSPETEINIL